MKTWLKMLVVMVVLLGFTATVWSYKVVVLPANAVIDWLKAEGKADFPETYVPFDGHPRPKGYRNYFERLYLEW